MNFENVKIKKYFLGCAIFLIFVLTILRPEASRGLNLINGFAFWFLQILVLVPILLVTISLLQKLKISYFNPWLKVFISGLIGAIIFIPFALLFDYFFRLDDWDNVDSTAKIFLMFLDEAAGVIPPVILIWFALNTPLILELNFSSAAKEVKEISLEESKGKACDFTAKFQKIGEDLLYIAAELHYIKIVTKKGNTLILSSISDAVAELEECYQGFQIHRSYWVVKEHSKRILKEKNQDFLELSNGHKLPISRRRLADLKKFLNSEVKVT